MSKERLEEFKKQIDFLDDSADMEDFGRFVDTIQNMYEDGEFHWIVRYLKEQAERVQELEKDVKEWEIVNESWEEINTQIVEQNKRYRERLEYMLEEAKDHKKKGLRIQHWALIKDLEKALEGEE